MRLVRIVILSAALGALALGFTPAPGVAMTTFSGHCDFAGVARMFPTVHLVPAATGYTVTADGTCDGTLNGKPYQGPVHTTIYANMHGPMSCAAGFSANGGPWYISFPGAAQPAPAAAPAKVSAARSKPHSSERKVSKGKHRGKHRRKHHRHPPKPPPYHDPPAASEIPELAAWGSSTNAVPGEVLLTYHGAYRGVAAGVNWFKTNADSLNECLGSGIEDVAFNGSFDTIQELRG
jgi:hypothetical protein